MGVKGLTSRRGGWSLGGKHDFQWGKWGGGVGQSSRTEYKERTIGN